mmetsp:Transcript_15288/g.49430  ORF Transcript_15288/g.49430 Transcript_15288/m.49430 type:complete len:304 (-) Transcript_15288:122-1033(-)
MRLLGCARQCRPSPATQQGRRPDGAPPSRGMLGGGAERGHGPRPAADRARRRRRNARQPEAHPAREGHLWRLARGGGAARRGGGARHVAERLSAASGDRPQGRPDGRDAAAAGRPHRPPRQPRLDAARPCRPVRGRRRDQGAPRGSGRRARHLGERQDGSGDRNHQQRQAEQPARARGYPDRGGRLRARDCVSAPAARPVRSGQRRPAASCAPPAAPRPRTRPAAATRGGTAPLAPLCKQAPAKRGLLAARAPRRSGGHLPPNPGGDGRVCSRELNLSCGANPRCSAKRLSPSLQPFAAASSV